MRDHITAKERLSGLDNCENDCSHHCIGCDKSFHQIKEDTNIPHDEELKDICWWGDAIYCSDHCYPR